MISRRGSEKQLTEKEYMPYMPEMQPMPWRQGCLPNCIPQETVLTNVKLATAYVPFQKLCSTLSPVEGLIKGTIFPELVSPYVGENKKCRPAEYDE